VVACALITCAAWAAAPRPPPARKVPVVAAPDAAPAPGLTTQKITLREIGAFAPISLRGLDDSVYLPLSMRLDQSVVSAHLHLNYTFSPALLPGLSMIKVMVNDEPLATIVAAKDRLGTPQSADIDLDPRYLIEFAKVRLQFIGHYTTDCEFPFHSSLWASVSNDSTLELTVRPLALSNDLALLPAPFFDLRDNRRLELPFVFAARPSLQTVQTAGMLASWFGAAASYRGAVFPALFDRRPTRHAVVLATNDERPASLDLPKVDAPTIALMADPQQPALKWLVVLGRDAAQLHTAAQALLQGQAALSGDRVEVAAVKPPHPRAAYDAPNMVKTDTQVRLGDLVHNAEELQVSGTSLAPIRLSLRLPADIFTWQSHGLPMDLRFRYTPPLDNGSGALAVQINDELIRGFELSPTAPAGRAEQLVLPFLEDTAAIAAHSITLPAFRLGSNNQLQFKFDLPPAVQGKCRSGVASVGQASIDPDSTLDLTDVEHYAAMPNLAYFANSGFPFTKFADLSETALVVPDAPQPAEVEAALIVLGQMGAATGMPATRFVVLGAGQVREASDRDLLVIAGGEAPALLDAWGQTLPARLAVGRRAASALGRLSDVGAEWFTGAMAHDLPDDGATDLKAQGPLAAMFGFESPLARGRSVVVLNATDASTLSALTDALLDAGKVRLVRGDLVLVHGASVDAFRVGDVYYVGHLRWWHWLWFQLHTHPLLLAAAGFVLSALVALIVFGTLRRRAARRLAGQS